MKDKFQFTTKTSTHEYTAERTERGVKVTWPGDVDGYTYRNVAKVEQWIKDGSWQVIEDKPAFPPQFIAVASEFNRYLMTQIEGTQDWRMVYEPTGESHGTRSAEKMQDFLKYGYWLRIEDIEDVPDVAEAETVGEFDQMVGWCEKVGASITIAYDRVVTLHVFRNDIEIEGWEHLERIKPAIEEYNEARNKLLDVGFNL